MIDYTKVLPFVLAAIQDAWYSTGLVSPTSCNFTAFPRSSPDSDTPSAFLQNTSSPDNTTSATNQDDAMLDTSLPSPSYGLIGLLVMLISQLAFFAHQLRRISKVVDVLFSFVTLEQTTDLEMTNLHITMELVKQDLDSVEDRSRCHEQTLAHETREFASLVADQQCQIDNLGKQLHEERELSRDIKKNLEKLTYFKDQLRTSLTFARNSMPSTNDQLRTENDVANLRKDIPKTLSLYHTRISALEFALSQAKLPASPQVVVYDSKPVRRATFAEANPLPEQVCPDPQNLPIPTNTARKTQRLGISTPATPLLFIDRESIYIQKSARISSKAAGVPTKPTTPKIPTTVDSVRRPVTVKPSVSRVLPSSKIATPGTKVSSAPKAGVLKTPTSKGIDAPSDIPARRESVTPGIRLEGYSCGVS
ncbi:hypothetical protein DFH29DRAFT_1002017 [Suillus ampliporus]|nr:hypothetical protein DFH29DRAFT_1002017 [Suillus ampliporus]